MFIIYIYILITSIILNITNIKCLRGVSLIGVLLCLVYNSYLLITYLSYNFYFDSLFFIFKIENISFFNFFYIMYDGISLILIFLTLILYLVSIIAS